MVSEGGVQLACMTQPVCRCSVGFVAVVAAGGGLVGGLAVLMAVMGMLNAGNVSGWGKEDMSSTMASSIGAR